MKARGPEPAEIQYKNMRFLITCCPSDSTLDKFIDELLKHGAQHVVRVCNPSYSTEKLKTQGIDVMDWQFEDGHTPPQDVVGNWFSLLKASFTQQPGCCVAVHCAAGLGRAPVLVAIALMEAGMKYEDAVELIRRKRRGAINSKQLLYLQHYRPKSRLRHRANRNGHTQCLIL
ncbi:hypothetical protein ACOMHN_056895 [Nucella lapillus]